MGALIKYILFVFILSTFGCKKQKPAETTTAAPVDPNIATNLNAQEQNLIGYWTLDSAAQYNNSVWQSSYPGTSVYLTLRNTKSSAGCLPADSSYYYGMSYPSGGSSGAWSAKQSNLLIISVPTYTPCNSTYTIVSLTPSSLAYKGYTTTAGGATVLYYHK